MVVFRLGSVSFGWCFVLTTGCCVLCHEPVTAEIVYRKLAEGPKNFRYLFSWRFREGIIKKIIQFSEHE